MNLEELIRIMNSTYMFNHDTHPEGHTSNLHAHRSYELFIMESGATTMLLDDKLIPLSQNEILLIQPDHIHKNNGGHRHSRYAVHFTMDYLSRYIAPDVCEALTEIFQNDKLLLNVSAIHSLLDVLKRMETEFGQRYPYVHIAELLSIISDQSNHVISPPRADNAMVQMIMSYIHENYADVTGLDDIAAYAGISKEYLCQIFKRETGLTVSHYMNGVRINRSCELLKSGKTNITETALLCGYNSSMYFCKIFKSILNMTPKEYRKQVNRDRS